MKQSIRYFIVFLVRKLKINRILFFLKKKDEFVEISEKTVREAKRLLEEIHENSDTTSIRQNNMNPIYDLQIIVPAYNVEKYIEDCIESALKIKTENSYIITVVNDGSTDNTREKLKKYEDNSKIKIIDQDNRGFSGARNRALENIMGKYIFFLDSDDYINPVAISKMLDKAIKEELDLVQAGVCYVSEEGKPFRIRTGKSTYTENSIGVLHGLPCGKIIKSELFANLCFPERYWFEDSIFGLIVLPIAKRAAIIPDIIYYYRMNPNSISHTSTGKIKAIDSYYVTIKLFEEGKFFGAWENIDYFEQVLRHLPITYKRTAPLGTDVQKAIFILWCDFYDKYFEERESKIKETKYLKKALQERNFGSYAAACKYL